MSWLKRDHHPTGPSTHTPPLRRQCCNGRLRHVRIVKLSLENKWYSKRTGWRNVCRVLLMMMRCVATWYPGTYQRQEERKGRYSKKEIERGGCGGSRDRRGVFVATAYQRLDSRCGVDAIGQTSKSWTQACAKKAKDMYHTSVVLRCNHSHVFGIQAYRFCVYLHDVRGSTHLSTFFRCLV